MRNSDEAARLMAMYGAGRLPRAEPCGNGAVGRGQRDLEDTNRLNGSAVRKGAR